MKDTMAKTGFLIIFVLVSLVSAGIAAEDWPFLKHYDQQHLAQIALPLGGIGTGTVSLGGRGDLKDWEIMNRPAKGFNPGAPFFAIWLKTADGKTWTRALQGPVERFQYNGPFGVKDATNPGLPCFRDCSFDGGYPFGRSTSRIRTSRWRSKSRHLTPLSRPMSMPAGFPLRCSRMKSRIMPPRT